ncbi:EVE domain-containing protein [Hymenobacter cyanobacteriorum]|uniref:EVE domain-containing protein n=1 Tax=Hymenobacter cyanobacteriorum TaxID=2926463 RepID=UPI0030D2B04D
MPVAALPRPLPLAELRTVPALVGLGLLRQPRLAVMPLTETEYLALLALSEQPIANS